jgi:hypothetical protein
MDAFLSKMWVKFIKKVVVLVLRIADVEHRDIDFRRLLDVQQ